MNRTSRRAALGAILAAPLATSPVAAKANVPGISPELARLIRKSRIANARVDAEINEPGFLHGSVRAAAALRCRVARFPSNSIADVLAKARHTVAVWDHDCCQEEFEAATARAGPTSTTWRTPSCSIW